MGPKKHRRSASEAGAYHRLTTHRKFLRGTRFEAANGCEAYPCAERTWSLVLLSPYIFRGMDDPLSLWAT